MPRNRWRRRRSSQRCDHSKPHHGFVLPPRCFGFQVLAHVLHFLAYVIEKSIQIQMATTEVESDRNAWAPSPGANARASRAWSAGVSS